MQHNMVQLLEAEDSRKCVIFLFPKPITLSHSEKKTGWGWYLTCFLKYFIDGPSCSIFFNGNIFHSSQSHTREFLYMHNIIPYGSSHVILSPGEIPLTKSNSKYVCRAILLSCNYVKGACVIFWDNLKTSTRTMKIDLSVVLLNPA